MLSLLHTDEFSYNTASQTQFKTFNLLNSLPAALLVKLLHGHESTVWGCGAFWMKSPVSSVLLRCEQRFNSFVFSADSLKHKTHPLWLVVAQHAPLFHQPVCSLGFLCTNKTFLPSWATFGSSVSWQAGILDSLTFSEEKKDKVCHQHENIMGGLSYWYLFNAEHFYGYKSNFVIDSVASLLNCDFFFS